MSLYMRLENKIKIKTKQNKNIVRAHNFSGDRN